MPARRDSRHRQPARNPLDDQIHTADALPWAGERAMAGVGEAGEVHRRLAELLEPGVPLLALRDRAAIVFLGGDHAHRRRHPLHMGEWGTLAVEVRLIPWPAVVALGEDRVNIPG